MLSNFRSNSHSGPGNRSRGKATPLQDVCSRSSRLRRCRPESRSFGVWAYLMKQEPAFCQGNREAASMAYRLTIFGREEEMRNWGPVFATEPLSQKSGQLQIRFFEHRYGFGRRHGEAEGL